uniref:Dual specificity protein phosphatase n=1 Tax=Strigamia maritima TaxID=126957 RepID=T1JDA7_STRMM
MMPSKDYVSMMMMDVSKPVSWLCEQLSSTRNEILLLDCRATSEFQQAHIRGSINVSLPSLMLRRLANGKLNFTATIKSNEGRERFSKTCKTHTIVLCDERGDESIILQTLLRRLLQDGCRVVFLEGGFKTFHTLYPEWCRVEGGDTPVLGLQNLHISSCSDSESEDDPYGCDSSFGTTPFDDPSFPVEILPHLFLGNAKNSSDQAALEKYHIKYILNVTANLPNTFEQDPSIKYLKIPISDHLSQNLATFFPDAIAFIDEARRQQLGVLVHCLAGISRSVTITVAYLMHSQNLSLNDAYDFVKQRKANISPNFNFMGQLLDFEHQLSSSPAHSSIVNSCSSSAFSSPVSNTFSPFCTCHSRNGDAQIPHASPDSGVEFENWT